jgi:hypothetical protein
LDRTSCELLICEATQRSYNKRDANALNFWAPDVWAHDEAMTHEVGAVVCRYRGCHSRDL